MLSVRLPINNRLLVNKFWENQKLYTDLLTTWFVGTPTFHVVQESTIVIYLFVSLISPTSAYFVLEALWSRPMPYSPLPPVTVTVFTQSRYSIKFNTVYAFVSSLCAPLSCIFAYKADHKKSKVFYVFMCVCIHTYVCVYICTHVYVCI